MGSFGGKPPPAELERGLTEAAHAAGPRARAGRAPDSAARLERTRDHRPARTRPPAPPAALFAPQPRREQPEYRRAAARHRRVDRAGRFSSATICPISGWRPATSGSRSLRTSSRRRNATGDPPGGRRRELFLAASPCVAIPPSYASLVLTPKSGSTSTTHHGGRSAMRRSAIAAPETEGGAASRGRTARPRRASPRSAPGAQRRSSRARARRARSSAAAASLLPPPRPACSGIRLSRWTRTPRGAPRRPPARHTRSAARQTRLVRSTGTPDRLQSNLERPAAWREGQRIVQRQRLKRRAAARDSRRRGRPARAA